MDCGTTSKDMDEEKPGLAKKRAGFGHGL